jgi:GH24 family phage-related lysozyme (muramidase)
MTPKERAIALALAAAIAIPAEGLRQVAYHDPVGILTTCYGTTGPDVVVGKVYTLQECRALLDRDMNLALDYVDRCAPGLPLPVLAAFADATYNLGPRIACDTRNSTAARKLKAGDIKGACNELPRWDKVTLGGQFVALPGLTKRRAKEQALCLTAT